MKINVQCYSGYKADETPRCIQFESNVVEVKEIMDRWLAPDHRYFKLMGDDGATYIIRQDLESFEWVLTYYKKED
jgi:hypothetical protein